MEDPKSTHRPSLHQRQSVVKTNIHRNFLTTISDGKSLTGSRSSGEGKVDADDEDYKTTVSVTISIAIAAPVGIEQDNTVKVLASPTAKFYIHTEYSLLPGDEEPVRTDIAIFGTVVKIYTENQDPVIGITWMNGDSTWVSWTHSHVVKVTEPLLTSLLTHSLRLSVRDGIENVSAAVRADRPKAIKVVQLNNEEVTGVQLTVLRQCENYQNRQPKNNNASSDTAAAECLNQVSLAKSSVPIRQDSMLEDVAPFVECELLEPSASAKGGKGKKAGKMNNNNSVQVPEVTSAKSKLFKPVEQDPITVSIQLSRFFATDTCLFTERGDDGEQERKLNPLCIQVHSANNMPNEPVSYRQLQQQCRPAYVRYKLLHETEHVSAGARQERRIYWDDFSVILTGNIESVDLRQFLCGPGFSIEVHDRDRYKIKSTPQPLLFGEDVYDELINSCRYPRGRLMQIVGHSSDAGQGSDSYGVSHVDLSEFLLGLTEIRVKCPISCVKPSITSRAQSSESTGSAVKPANYFLSGATLKIMLTLAHPLVSLETLSGLLPLFTTSECPFGRLVYKFDCRQASLIGWLQTEIRNINAKALDCGTEVTGSVLDAILSTTTLAPWQLQDPYLDIVTGFQLMDGRIHLFVLEGLRTGAIKYLTDNMNKTGTCDIEVLYHSGLGYKQRQYEPLGVGLFSVQLHEPLVAILHQPLLHCTGMLPANCSDTLNKLDQLCNARMLREAIRLDLFPSSDEIICLSRELAIPLAPHHFQVENNNSSPRYPNTPPTSSSQPQQQTRDKETLEISINQRERSEPLELSTNQRERSAPLEIAANQRERIKLAAADNTVELSHTVDRLNLTGGTGNKSAVAKDLIKVQRIEAESVEQALEKIREIVTKDKSHVYSYNPEYHHSMSFSCVDVKKILREEESASRARYMTSNGWMRQPHKTGKDSRVETWRLHPARISDLHGPAEDLYTVTSSSNENFRSRYPWSQRRQDLNTWSPVPRPPYERLTLFGLTTDENNEIRTRQMNDWKSKLIVDDIRGQFHRCAIETELTARGPKSSDQLSRLKGLRKDPPCRPAFNVPSTPALAVVHYAGVDTERRLIGLDLPNPILEGGPGRGKGGGNHPGPFSDKSLLHKDNIIPMYDYQRKLFQDKYGQDFNVFHKNVPLLYTRRITPLEVCPAYFCQSSTECQAQSIGTTRSKDGQECQPILTSDASPLTAAVDSKC